MTEQAVTFDAKAFARRIYRREVFLSDMIRPEHIPLLGTVFMPLALLDEDGRKDLRERDVTCLYGEMKDAGINSINGYPIFSAFGTLTREEHLAAILEYHSLLELLGELENENGSTCQDVRHR